MAKTLLFSCHESPTFRGRLHVAGLVCRDEIQPGFTWSGPARDTRGCFGAVILLAWVAGLAHGECDCMEKLGPVIRDPGIALPGSLSDMLARLSYNPKLIFDVFNRHTRKQSRTARVSRLALARVISS